MRKQVSSFIDKKGFLNSTQHGFRSGRSCLSALWNVFDDGMHMLDGGGSVGMMYLDFSKVFQGTKRITGQYSLLRTSALTWVLDWSLS